MTRTAVVVCGAGVSSTFLARSLRRALQARDADWKIEPLALEQLVEQTDRVEHVIIGHHLAERASEIVSSLTPLGVRATLLQTPGTGDDAAREAVTHLLGSLTEQSGEPRG
jgi:cellobiose PTS system EIIB component